LTVVVVAVTLEVDDDRGDEECADGDKESKADLKGRMHPSGGQEDPDALVGIAILLAQGDIFAKPTPCHVP
jgi:hypothetical protein